MCLWLCLSPAVMSDTLPTCRYGPVGFSPAMRGPDEQGSPAWGALAHSSPAAWGGAATQLQTPQTIFREAMMADEAQVQQPTPPMILEMCNSPSWGMPALLHVPVQRCSCRYLDIFQYILLADRHSSKSAAPVAGLTCSVAAAFPSALCLCGS